MGVDDADRAEVRRLLGREPRGQFAVVVRGADGQPVVIRNSPLLDDGTPMPTRYWLVGEREREAVSRLESSGGVDQAERAVDPDELSDAHRRYAEERSAVLPQGWSGPRPEGGVGGTRRGVKCLHAHLAWYLAGGEDPVGRYVAARLAGPAVAAVDCGTNSTRLLVAAPWPFGCGLVDPPVPVSSCGGLGLGTPLIALRREMRITRLGEGVDATGVLAGAAIARCVEVLDSYQRMSASMQVTALRAVATSAVRDAGNRDEFLDAAGAVLGVRPEVLDGQAEGALSFAGATVDLAPEQAPALVVDIGGGSTELVTGPTGSGAAGGGGGGTISPKLTAAVSLPIGCVRLTERHLHHDPPRVEEIDAARAEVVSLLEATAAANPSLLGATTFVGLAGTVSALAMIDLGLDRYETALVHGHEMTRSRVESLLEELASQPVEQRRLRLGLEPARAEVIVGGAIVLVEALRCLKHESLVVSERDILDGVAMSLGH